MNSDSDLKLQKVWIERHVDQDELSLTTTAVELKKSDEQKPVAIKSSDFIGHEELISVPVLLIPTPVVKEIDQPVVITPVKAKPKATKKKTPVKSKPTNKSTKQTKPKQPKPKSKQVQKTKAKPNLNLVFLVLTTVVLTKNWKGIGRTTWG
ncbi:hypothetical protein CM5_01290 [Mycoplasmoides genitalium M2288]|uniref:hypothetical protein n=1 Tax=Mycoplasmoides genitalium TaxID=2097 RepID=UPI00027B3898|nr:hypothetical protein [Mycoplasmoides genitalium]AFQ04541.1 hypothetical protein CM5_01290 [Mycoplasmoides genitalium M2288]